MGDSPGTRHYLNGLFSSFRDAEHVRQTLIQDFKTLDPVFREISTDLDRLLPKSPTAVFTDLRFFDDDERMKKIIAGVIELDADKRKKQ
jgi:hypothetical protein